MKKILLSILFILSLIYSVAQLKIVRSTGSNTVYDTRLGALKNFFPPLYPDTISANLPDNIGLDTVGALIFTTNEQTYWMRVADPSKRWVQIGGTVEVQNSNSIFLSGDGSSQNPLTATIIVSGQPNNIVQSLADGIFVPSFIQNGLISGGSITWVSGYTYDVTTANYVIGGVPYVAPETQFTLSNADPTLNRFDLPVVNTNSTITVITGTPADDPQVPSYDPLTQLPLTPILVTAGSTQPTVNQEWIYINNTEWTTTTSTPRINLASTNNPYSPTVDIEATLARNTDFITFTDPSPPTTTSLYTVVSFKIRSKLAFNTTSRIDLRFYNGASAVGNVVSLSDGAYGFNSGQTASYQTMTIPLPQFGAIPTVTALYITVTTIGGNTIGFYIDDIQLQNAIVPFTGNFWALYGNSWGTLGVLGTNDNQHLAFETNNVERMRILNTGSVLIGTTTNIGSFALQVSGTTTSNVGIFPVLASATSSDVANFAVRNGTSVDASSIPELQLGGATTSNRVLMRGSTTPTLSTGHSYASFEMGTMGVNLTATGHPIVAGMALKAPLITGAGSAVDMTTFYITGAPIGSNVTGQRNAAWIASGNTRFGEAGEATGTISFEGITSGRIGIQPANAAGTYTLTLPTTDGAANEFLQTDGNGVLTWAAGGTTITADNGLTLASNNVKLGGSPLTANTTIPISAFTFTMNSSAGGNAISVLNTNGPGIYGQTDAALYAVGGQNTFAGGYGVLGVSTNNGFGVRGEGVNGVWGKSTTSYGLVGEDELSTTDVYTASLLLRRATSGTAAIGIGGGIDFQTQMSNGTTPITGRIKNITTSVTSLTRGSSLAFTVLSTGSEFDRLIIDPDGSFTVNGYGTGAITGTPTYLIATDASGNLIETALGAGSMTNPMTTAGDIIYSSDGAGTPTRLGVASNGDVLTLVAGIPAWVTPGTGGTVTSVTGTSNRITITGTPTVAPVIDIAATYVGQASITTLGTIATGVWQGTSIGTGFTDANIVTVTGTTNRLTIGGTATDPTFDISTSYVGQATITTLGTIATGTWQATPIATTYAGTPTGGTVGQVLVKNSSTNYDYSWSSAGAGTVTNVTGTANRITVATGTTTPVIDISSNYIGQGTITTLGTITSGTWNGTAITVPRGGTGLTSATSATILIGNASNGWTQGTPTGSNGITITMGSGTFNISNVYNPAWQTLVDGATITWTVANGANSTVTLAGTGRTLSIPSPVDGHTYTIRIIQGSGGSKTITTWPLTTKWQGGSAPTLSTTAGQYDIISLKYQASTGFYYGTYGLNFQ